MFNRSITSVFVGILLVSILCLTGYSLFKQETHPFPHPESGYIEGRVLVKFSRGLSASAVNDIAAGLGIEAVKNYKALARITGHQYALIESADMTTPELLQMLKKQPKVAAVSPDYRVHALDRFPDDPQFGNLWGLHNTGQSGGTPDIDIDAPEGWDFSTGSESVVVGIIDSGIDYHHSDLQSNMWTNPGEIAGNGIDDDGNGWVDDIHGINTIVDTGNPMDDNGHGTRVAGIIGAAGNNAAGVTGVNWNVKMIAGKFLNVDGNGNTSDAIECLNYFVDLKTNQGVNIVAINCSYGGSGYSSIVEDAINAAGSAGIIVCAAAGNEGTDNDTDPFYPASYDCDNIISVTGVDRNGSLMHNYGASSVDLGAPGSEILSTAKGSYTPSAGDFFFDDMESGAGQWTTGGTNNSWAISEDQEGFENPSYPVPSPTHFWSDSPGSDYAGGTDAWLMNAFDLDLSSFAGQPVHLGFGAAIRIERFWIFIDHGYVEVSGDGGDTWTTLVDFSGFPYYWWPDYDFALPEEVKTSHFRMRFRLVSDYFLEQDGWLLDDIGVGTNINFGYQNISGTSAAAPFATGAAAICAAAFPSESMSARIDRIINGAAPLASLSGKCVSGGMLNLYGALTQSPDISGTVTDGGTGLANVYMEGLPHNTFTNGSGEYSDYTPFGWSGTVTPALTGYSFTPEQRTYINVNEDQTAQDYAAAILTYEISGTVTTGGSGLENVVMGGLPGDPVTNAAGEYSGTVDHDWSGTVTPVLDCYSFSPESIEYTNITENQSGEDYTAVLDTFTISGAVTEDGSGLEGVVISGLPGDPATSSDGEYSATVDCGWSGTVTPTLEGYIFTPASQDFSDVHEDQIQDFTAEIITYIISGTVTEGGTGLENVIITGLPGDPVTNSSGEYSAPVDYGWSGTVTPFLDCNSFDPASRDYTDVTADQTGEDYTASLNTYTISGTVTEEGTGQENVTMTGLPGNPATNSSGTYSATVDCGWSGTVTPALTGYAFTPASKDYTDVHDDQTQNYTAELLTYTISGTVTDGGSGLTGVTMTGLPSAPVTAGDGTYSDTVDYGWGGTAVPALAGYSFTPESISYTGVTADQTGQDYTATLLTYTISGTVTDGGSGLTGVTMTGLPSAPVTAGDGTYSDTVDYGWGGTAVPALAGYSFTPESINYGDVTADQTGQDYTAVLLTYTISGTVSEGGSGLTGVTITGLPSAPVTAGDGTYSDTVDYGWSGTAVPALAGYSFTPESIAYSNVTADQTGQDYTATLLTYTIAGTVTSGGSGLSGVTITGLPASPGTIADGSYSDTVDYGWGGTAVPALAGYSFTPESITYSNVTADQTGRDYTATPLYFTISGTVTADSAELAGVTITGLPSAPVTAANGTYSDTVDHGWSGTAAPVLAGYSFTPDSINYTNVTADQTGQDYTAALLTYTISGTVTAGGSGLSGVTITGLPASPATSGDGTYNDTVDHGWSGTAAPMLAGYSFTPDSINYTNVAADQTGQDYTAALLTYTISGTVTAGGSGLSGVTITGLPASPATSGDGTYNDTVDHGWSGTAAPVLAGYSFTPDSINYTNVAADQTGQDYTASLIAVTIAGTVTESGAGLSGVTLSGLPTPPVTAGDGTYNGTADYGWSGTVTPVLAGYLFSPENRTYTNVTEDQTGQDYTAEAFYANSPSNYQVIPEVLWAPAVGAGIWMTEIQITDVTGNSEVSVYFNSASGERRGPFVLWTSSFENFSVKFDNILSTLAGLDDGYSYYQKLGAMEFVTQDPGHKIHVTARTRNGNYSKTFQGLNHNDDNTAAVSRPMMIQNMVSNETFRTAYGGFNPTEESVAVEFELIDSSGNTIGSTFTRNVSGHQYAGFSPFTEAGVPYPEYSYDNVWMKITPVSGSGELISFGATANNNTNDPAVHIAVQAGDIGGFNSPSNYQVIPEVLWAEAAGGGTWMTEVQITDITGGSEVSVYFNSTAGVRRGPVVLFTGTGPGTSVKTSNLLNILSQLDSGFNYEGQVGTVEFVTQDESHKIQVIARTLNENYSKTFQGLSRHTANTLGTGRTMMVQNLLSTDTFRTAFGAFNPTDDSVTATFTLIDQYGNTIGTPVTKSFSGHHYQAFSPFSEAGVPYPNYTYNNTWIKVEVTSGSGQLIMYGASANSVTNDPASHKAVQY